jgi:hypothetical protein
MRIKKREPLDGSGALTVIYIYIGRGSVYGRPRLRQAMQGAAQLSGVQFEFQQWVESGHSSGKHRRPRVGQKHHSLWFAGSTSRLWCRQLP